MIQIQAHHVPGKNVFTDRQNDSALKDEFFRVERLECLAMCQPGLAVLSQKLM